MIYIIHFLTKIKEKYEVSGTFILFLICLSFFNLSAKAQEHLPLNRAIIVADNKNEKEYNVAVFFTKRNL